MDTLKAINDVLVIAVILYTLGVLTMCVFLLKHEKPKRRPKWPGI